jgi:hypothetical protein
MRTKTLLLTAALCAAGIATSEAQVYSVNAVGYVNTPLLKNFNLISNPLNNTGTGGNVVKTLFASLPGGSQVYVFNGTNFDTAIVDDFTGEITGPAADKTVAPGNGVFVRVDAAGTITFVGEVPAGSLVNDIPKGFSVKASQVPQAGKLVDDLKFPAAEGDQIYKYVNASGTYAIYTFTFGAWDAPAGFPADPTLDVGEAVFVRTDVAKAWTRDFDISK